MAKITSDYLYLGEDGIGMAFNCSHYTKEEAIKEYIQMDMTFENIKNELEKLLNDKDYRKRITTDYKRLKELTGKTGTSKRAAEKMTKLLKTDNFQ